MARPNVHEERWRKQQDRLSLEGPQNQERQKRSPLDRLKKQLRVREDTTQKLHLTGTMRGIETDVIRTKAMGGHRWLLKLFELPVQDTLSMQSERRLSSVTKAFKGDVLLTGDKTFDEEVFIEGDEIETLALLSQRGRELTMSLIRRGMTLKRRRLELACEGGEQPPAVFITLIATAHNLATQMKQTRDSIGRRLRKNINVEQDPLVQLRYIEALRKHDERALYGLRLRTLYKLSLELRARFALALGVAGTTMQMELASDERVPIPTRLDMLRTLGRREPFPGMLKTFELALDDPLLRKEATLLLIEMHLEAGIIEELEQPALLEMFEKGRTPLRIEIAARLIEVGTPEALVALLPHTSGLFVNSTLKTITRRAVTAIEKRAGANRGQLSIAEGPTGGNLSLSGEDQRGDISLADQE